MSGQGDLSRLEFKSAITICTFRTDTCMNTFHRIDMVNSDFRQFVKIIGLVRNLTQ